MPPASGWRTPSAANVIASGTESASSPAQASDGRGAGGLGGERGEEQDAGAEHGADVQGGGGAGGEHGDMVPPIRGHVVPFPAPAESSARAQ